MLHQPDAPIFAYGSQQLSGERKQQGKYGKHSLSGGEQKVENFFYLKNNRATNFASAQAPF